MGAIALNNSSSGASIPADNVLTTTNGVYNNGAGLTSVGSIKGSDVTSDSVTPNIGGSHSNVGVIKMDKTSKIDTYAQTPMVCLFGSKVKAGADGALVDATSEAYSSQVAPKAIKVTLTLVPATQSTPVNK